MYSSDIERAVISRIKELGNPAVIGNRDFPCEIILVAGDYVLIEVYRERTWYNILAMVFVRQRYFYDMDEFEEAFNRVKEAPRHPVYGINFLTAPVYDYWFPVNIDDTDETREAKMGIQTANLQYHALKSICVKSDIMTVQKLKNVTGLYGSGRGMKAYGTCCTMKGVDRLLAVDEVADMYRRGMLDKYLEIMAKTI